MPFLYPDPAAVRSCGGVERDVHRQSQPGMSVERFTTFMEAPFETQYFKSAHWVRIKASTWSPRLDPDFLVIVPEEVCFADVVGTGRSGGAQRSRVEGDALLVARHELAQFHEDCAAGRRAGRMTRSRGIAYVGSRRIVAMFVLENAFQNEEFFACIMGVWGKAAFGRIAHD